MNEEDISLIMKEFNITEDSLNVYDPTLANSAGKEFFEKMTLREKKARRTVMDAKVDFYSEYRTPILPQYKTFLSEFLTVLLLQVEDGRYEYDALHAFGICTHYYTIMKGYPLEDEVRLISFHFDGLNRLISMFLLQIDLIFNALARAVKFDPVRLRDDAKRILTYVQQASLTGEEILNAEEGELAPIFNNVRNNRFFKYCDSWGVGLARIMELKGIEPNMEAFDKWCRNLKNVFASRLLDSWVEFSSDQVKMQGIEAMQKQILIREKRRAADRLEEKASLVEQEKKKILDLNIAIREKKKIDKKRALEFLKENSRSQSEYEQVLEQIKDMEKQGDQTYFKFK